MAAGRTAIAAALICVAIAIAVQAAMWSYEYADRLASIDVAKTVIDNDDMYSSEGAWATTGPLAMLHKITPIRVDYFDAALASLVAARQPLHVLDAGSGGGLVSNALAQRGYNVTGIDQSIGAVGYARRTAAALQQESSARFEVGSIYELPFDSGSFDAVVCSDVLEHLGDLPKVLRELRRVLRPNGLLLVDTINRTLLAYLIAIFGAERVLGAVPIHGHDWRLFIKPQELASALQVAGFRVSEAGFPGFRPSVPMFLDTLRAYLLGTLPVESISSDCVLESSPGMVSYFATAVAVNS
eukprot:gnl/TRDRNA2_/TRDRNA2_68483_c0_seq1.p1 gnl/TRDRNA2_/TRDRNA2_68483_c0~~gnl/TRDRNA2_/TRDRNA2_68483_c0_seq1.p1  ORF type:complete len:298 (+),score=40.28 gnl/TRDRNA2_/TRDRNA2_68483_c0_seq1:57-950(+)